jgi:outer membrane protein OmpA-like peptidoglycan-associated protein
VHIDMKSSPSTLLVLLSGGLLLAASLSVAAQNQVGWALGLGGGATFYGGELSTGNVGTFREQALSERFHLQGRWSPYWATTLRINRGKLAASDQRYAADDYRAARNFSFRTKYLDLALLATCYPLGARRIEPSVSLGLARLYYDTEADLSRNQHPELREAIKLDQVAPAGSPAWVLPVQVALTAKPRAQLAFEVGAQLNFANTDYLDGVSLAGNPNNQDRYGSLYLAATLLLGNLADIDEDGIADAEDECPLKPGTLRTRGCPDNDLDGVPDADDRCPYAAGEASLDGCPDSDADGTPDPYDRCPVEAGPPEALGCPIVDTDGDGVKDHLDDCPLLAGPSDRRGCPAIDTDEDGILDEDDRCPLQFGPVLFEGCPDTDGDGIEDAKDACPEEFGLFDHGGCPEFRTPQEEAQLLSMQLLYFSPNSVELSNYALLDRLSAFLNDHPNYRLQIRGHADATGSDKAVNYISKQRALEVAQYLQDTGVELQRLQTLSRGDDEPLNEAGSLAGQAQNRRVEFTLEPIN